ncbi:hypothetical protein [Lewinella sp. W8]|uniref:hypothetical protein n=1 Tax=Lewinella sp. W8 TaxID=2528208 RepID=UPI00106797C8|nr:hypothetical protein [Lewinella sp. W8]MTB51761.1 hypothetical protein [Lewinella sp. W8]
MIKESFKSRNGKSYSSSYYDYFSLDYVKNLIADEETTYEEELGQLFPSFTGAEVYSLRNGGFLISQPDCASIYPDLETFSAWILESKQYKFLVKDRKNPFIIEDRIAEVLIETAVIEKDPEDTRVVYVLMGKGKVIFDETENVYQFVPG